MQRAIQLDKRSAKIDDRRREIRTVPENLCFRPQQNVLIALSTHRERDRTTKPVDWVLE